MHEAHRFTAAVALVLNCLFEFLTLINLSGVMSGRIGKDSLKSYIFDCMLVSDYYAKRYIYINMT